MRRFSILLAVVGVTSAIGLATSVEAQVPTQGTSAFGVPGGFTAPSAGAAGSAATNAATSAAQNAAQDATDAAAQQAAPVKKKPKPKPRKPKGPPKAGPGQVLVTNERAVGLRQLTMTSIKDPTKSAIVAKRLAPGAKAIGKLPAKSGCDFSISGEFDDGTSLDISNVEVCKDRALNLVE